jgi:hypothetical protein
VYSPRQIQAKNQQRAVPSEVAHLRQRGCPRARDLEDVGFLANVGEIGVDSKATGEVVIAAQAHEQAGRSTTI